MRLLVLLLTLCCVTARAHIGSPNVFLEGQAGPYPIRVVIRPPDVVPGLAEISVRVDGEPARQVTALPVFWNAGREGAPPPDVAELVRGETNLYTAMLWLMKSGAYSVDVHVSGAKGQGTLIVPVNASATNTRPMPRGFAVLLCVLGLLLFAAAVKIAGALFGESVLEPGAAPRRKDVWRERAAMAFGFAVVSLMLWGGRKWWEHEERQYRSNSLYQRAPVEATVREAQNQLVLDLKVDDAGHRGKWTRLIPDHGKMMHLFAVQEGGRYAFAHLHPAPQGGTRFQTALPPLPAGKYHLYADVTHENGFSETLTAEVSLPAPSPAAALLWANRSGEQVCSSSILARLQTALAIPPDPDDSWRSDQTEAEPRSSEEALLPNAPRIAELSGGYKIIWQPPVRLVENQEVSLRFRLLQPNGEAAPLESYMGMAGHAAIRREDGAVFSHLHPAGNFSMASQQFFEHRTTGTEKADLSSAATALSGASTNNSAHAQHAAAMAGTEFVTFPYAFPQPGEYRIWVQLKSRGAIFTGAFPAQVAAAKN